MAVNALLRRIKSVHHTFYLGIPVCIYIAHKITTVGTWS